MLKITINNSKKDIKQRINLYLKDNYSTNKVQYLDMVDKPEIMKVEYYFKTKHYKKPFKIAFDYDMLNNYNDCLSLILNRLEVEI